MAGAVVALSVGVSFGSFFSSRDDVSPSVLIVGKRHEAGREVVGFRVDVPWRRPAFLYEAKVLGQHGEQKPEWGSQPPAFQTYFTNSSPTFGVVAPADSSVWRLHLVIIVEASATRLAVKQVEYRLKTRKIGWGGFYAPTTHWLVSDPITNAVPKTSDAPRP